MPWQEVSIMSQRREFCRVGPAGRHQTAAASVAPSGISPTTGSRWLRRYQAEGAAGLQNRSRRPPALAPAHGPHPRKTSGPGGVGTPIPAWGRAQKSGGALQQAVGRRAAQY